MQVAGARMAGAGRQPGYGGDDLGGDASQNYAAGPGVQQQYEGGPGGRGGRGAPFPNNQGLSN